MPLYEYTTVDGTGKLATGKIFAGCENGAKLKLQRQCAGMGEHLNRPGHTPYDQPKVKSVVIKNIKEIPY